MAALMQIKITVEGCTVNYDPPSLAVEVGDQIFWTNNDENLPHWPGLKETDEVTIDKTFFMPNQIAPDSSSSTFSPSPPPTDPVCRITEYELVYVCSLPHDKPQQNDKPEQRKKEGKIVVRTP